MTQREYHLGVRKARLTFVSVRGFWALLSCAVWGCWLFLVGCAVGLFLLFFFFFFFFFFFRVLSLWELPTTCVFRGALHFL